MSHFAEVDNGVVVRVIVAEQDFIDSGSMGDSNKWIQTSYNVRQGIHYNPNSNIESNEQIKAKRKNFAGVGYIYDPIKDMFYEKKKFNSWIFNEFKGCWESPKPMPDDGKMYRWNENKLDWDLIIN